MKGQWLNAFNVLNMLFLAGLIVLLFNASAEASWLGFASLPIKFSICGPIYRLLFQLQIDHLMFAIALLVSKINIFLPVKEALSLKQLVFTVEGEKV